MKGKTTFRCPFEIKAESQGMILEISLGEIHQMRLELAQKAYETFFIENELTALKFILPDVVASLSPTLQALKTVILPYQCELCAAELTVRLAPFLLTSQLAEIDAGIPLQLMDKRNNNFIIAATVKKIFADEKFKEPETLEDVYRLYQHLFNPKITKDVFHPSVLLSQRFAGEKRKLATLSLEGADFLHENGGEYSDRAWNKNCFSFVRCPLYPEGVGRYSSRFEIVVTRQADLMTVPQKEAEKIQKRNIQILKQHGIVLGNEKQHAGLWIPFSKKRSS